MPSPASELLIVDDNIDAAETMRDLVMMLGFGAVVVHNVADALRQVRMVAPLRILLDVNMPDVDGLDFARQIRREFDPSIVLIAVTGAGAEDARAAATFAIVDHHLLKPVDVNVLERILLKPLAAAEGSST